MKFIFITLRKGVNYPKLFLNQVLDIITIAENTKSEKWDPIIINFSPRWAPKITELCMT